jgi:hypothetical protein
MIEAKLPQEVWAVLSGRVRIEKIGVWISYW